MRILTQHMANLRGTLLEHAKKASLAAHPDNLGDAREGFARVFLEENLPRTINFLTGEVFNSADERSGQIDLIVYPASSPRLNLFGETHLVLADFCLAAIEVKSNLTTASLDKPSHFKSALDSCVRLKRLGRMHPIQGSMVGSGPVALTTTPYMVFAYEGPQRETLEAKLLEYQRHNCIEDDLMPDIVTVLSRSYYTVRNNGWLTKIPEQYKWSTCEEDGVLIGMYAYLVKLIEAYAY